MERLAINVTDKQDLASHKAVPPPLGSSQLDRDKRSWRIPLNVAALRLAMNASEKQGTRR